MSTFVTVEPAFAAQLLAHWWSRPVEEEVSAWDDAWADARLAAATLGRDEAELEALAEAAVDNAGLLLDEYERLFVGPGRVPCPPYEALWRDDGQRREQGRLMSTATAAVVRLYRALGLAVRDDAHELPDQIVVELEALAYALDTQNAGTETATELLTGHLLVWVPKLCAVAEQETELDFYRRLACLTPGWLAAIGDSIGEPPAP